MTTTNIPPCPVCGVVPIKHAKHDRILLCGCFEEYGAALADVVSLQKYQLMCVDMLGRALRDLGIETVAQVRELVRIACDACDERTVRATNRAENLVPLLRRRAAEGLPKDNQEIISEKLSQSATEQAPGPTTKESSAVESTEIAKRAAWALLTDIPVELRRVSGGDCGHIDAANELADVCRQYIEAYDYAKSIGALSE